MTNLDLGEAMIEIAGRAPVPPPDLLERVEAGHRRQRRKHTITAAFAAVVVLTLGAWVALRPGGHDQVPADFRLPPLTADLPLLTETWPGATVTGPLPPSPYRSPVSAIGRIDAKHLLVISPGTGRKGDVARSAAIWNYTPADRSFRMLIQDSLIPPNPENVIVTANRIIHMDTPVGGRTRIWWTPRGGGQSVPVASIMVKDPPRDIYADDRNLYFTLRASTLPGNGIMRVSLTDGTAERLPGFEKMFTYGAPWALNVGATEFRYLATGEERRAVQPPGTDHFRCVPAFCLAHDAGGWFLQQVDGSGRTAPPYPGTPRMIGGFSTRPDAAGHREDAGLLLLGEDVLLDPVRGKLSRLADEPVCSAGGGWLKDELVVRWNVTRPDGTCDANATRTAYIGAGD